MSHFKRMCGSTYTHTLHTHAHTYPDTDTDADADADTDTDTDTNTNTETQTQTQTQTKTQTQTQTQTQTRRSVLPKTTPFLLRVESAFPRSSFLSLLVIKVVSRQPLNLLLCCTHTGVEDRSVDWEYTETQ